jgi:hypothetical protein
MVNYYIRAITDKLDQKFAVIETICIKRWFVIMVSKVLVGLFKIYNGESEATWVNEELFSLAKPIDKLVDFHHCFC